MNKKYIAPDMAIFHCNTAQVLMGSVLDPDSDTQTITPTDEEYGGEFKSRRQRDLWEDEEEEEENF